MTKYQKQYDQAFRQMNTLHLQSRSSSDFSMDDIMRPNGDLVHKTHLFLGAYPPSVIEKSFEQYKVREYFAKKGIDNVSWHININDPFTHKFILMSEENGIQHKLIELIMQRKNYKLPLEKNKYMNMEFLHIEWLMMQNPYKPFASNRPKLPGQEAPGLGIGEHMLQILFHLARKTNVHGIVNSPNYLHTALFFSRVFHFVDPKVEGFIQNVKYKLLRDYSLYTISWADEFGALQYARSHRPISWRPATQIVPISSQAKRYFNTHDYRQIVRKTRQSLKLTVNMKKLKKKMKVQ